jgi:uncharacterized membrane protein
MSISTPTLGRLGYQTAIFFAILGVYFCLSRYLVPTALHYEISLLLYGAEYTNEALPLMAKFSWTELSHRLLGAIFLVIGLFQFNQNFRRKRIRLHRAMGFVYFAFCITAAVSGFILAWFIPFGGWFETLVVTVVSLLMLYVTYRAFAAIKQRDIRTHERFTGYTYAIGLGVVTIRLFIHVLLYTPLPDRVAFDVGMVLGWTMTLGAVYYYHNRLASELTSA